MPGLSDVISDTKTAIYSPDSNMQRTSMSGTTTSFFKSPMTRTNGGYVNVESPMTRTTNAYANVYYKNEDFEDINNREELED